MRALKVFGVGYPQATCLISAFFAALSVIALGRVISTGGIPFMAFPVAVIASGYGHLSQLSTPDALTCFFSLWAMYCLLQQQKLVFVISALLPLMRTDSIVLSALLMAYSFRRGEKLLSCVSLLLSLAAYVLVNKWHGNYGLLTVFNFYFMQLSPFPAEMAISHRFSDYLPPYITNFRELLLAPGAQTLIYLLCIYVLIKHRDEAKKFAALHVFLTIPLCFIVLRLLAFPNYEERFFTFPASLILAGTLGILTSAIRAR
jgi:hypothetical protein